MLISEIESTPGLSLITTLFILDLTITLTLVLEDNKKNVKNKQILVTAKEIHKLAKKELRRLVKTHEQMSQKNIDEVKQITIDLYGENQEFDILEAFNISFLGLSELEHHDPDNRRYMVLCRKILKMILMFDPCLTFIEQHNEGWNKYESIVRNVKDDWGKYLAYTRGLDYENFNSEYITSVAI